MVALQAEQVFTAWKMILMMSLEIVVVLELSQKLKADIRLHIREIV